MPALKNLFERENKSAAQSELQVYLTSRQQRHRIFPLAALVGICAGAVALAFRVGLSEADIFRGNMISWSQQRPLWGWMVPVLFAAAGAFISVLLVRRFAPEASGSGIPHLEAALQKLRKLNWKKILPVKFFGGIISLGSGLALGREGPTVQMGGAVGDAIARWLKVSAQERRIMISSGAGAGLAAAFNAPMAGLIFVLEEVRRDFQPIVFGAAFLAAVIADVIARIGTGQFPVFAIPGYATPPLTSIPFFVLLGIIAGSTGVLFNRGLMKTINLYAKIPERFILPAAALVGGSIGLIGWFSPSLIGSGHVLAESALHGDIILKTIPLLFLARFLMTSVCYSTGAPGGIFAPMLALGALLGLGIGEIAHMIAPAAVPTPAVFAVVGMAAYFSAIVRTPLTGVVLILEMTGNYSQMLPLLIGCFCAYIVAEAMNDTPIYEALLQRDLSRSKDIVFFREPTVSEFVIEAGAPYAGITVRDLGLPPGCILIRCSEDGREWVPNANTKLRAHMRITAIISPEAFGGLELVRMGCTATEF